MNARKLADEIWGTKDIKDVSEFNISLESAINMMEKYAEIKSFKWIEAKRFLPEDNGCGESDYLALWIDGEEVENAYWTQGRYDHCKDRFHTMENENGEYEIIKSVTHWAIIPELPDTAKGEKNY